MIIAIFARPSALRVKKAEKENEPAATCYIYRRGRLVGCSDEQERPAAEITAGLHVAPPERLPWLLMK
jgi:hypothetical protein